jgi:hypothetical protein
MRTMNIARLALAMVLALSGSAAHAQPAPVFADLGVRLRAGDGVRVEHRDGTRVRGTVASVSPDALVITTAAGPQTFTAATTGRVVRLGDTVLNGAVVGLIPGFLLGLQLPGQTSDQRVDEGSGVKAGLITGLIGAAIGMAVDGARDGETEIYAAAPTARVTLAPFAGRGAMGAVASIRW